VLIAVAFDLQGPSQPCRARARSRDFGFEPVMQSDAVNPVAATLDALDRAQVHHGMPAYPDEWIAPEPVDEFGQGIIGGKLLEHSMDPGPPFPSQYRNDLVAS